MTSEIRGVNLNWLVHGLVTGEKNCVIFLGAGASRSSGMPTKKEICEDLKKRIFITDTLQDRDVLWSDRKQSEANLWITQQDWYKANRSESQYSRLMQHYNDTEWGRRKYLISLAEGKLPSRGLMNLASAIKQRVFRIILTTNLELLLEDALRQIGVEPLVLAHNEDMPPEILDWGHINNPIIIKLHSDFLWNPANSDKETRSRVDANTENKIRPLFAQCGLIVIGYSGEDKSIMRVLNNVAKRKDAFRHGIYWLHRPGSKLNSSVEKLIAHDNGAHCEIKDADSFFNELTKGCKHWGSDDQKPVVRRFDPDLTMEIKNRIDKLKVQYPQDMPPAVSLQLDNLKKDLENAVKKNREIAAALLGLFDLDIEIFELSNQYGLDLLRLALRQPEAFWVAEIDGKIVGYLSIFRMKGKRLYDDLTENAKNGTLDLPSLVKDYWSDIDESRSQDEILKMKEVHMYIDALAVPKDYRTGFGVEPTGNMLIRNARDDMNEITKLVCSVTTIAVNPGDIFEKYIHSRWKFLEPFGVPTQRKDEYRKLFVWPKAGTWAPPA